MVPVPIEFPASTSQKVPSSDRALGCRRAKIASKMLVSVAPAGLEKMFMEIGVPLAEGATTALPPTREEIARAS